VPGRFRLAEVLQRRDHRQRKLQTLARRQAEWMRQNEQPTWRDAIAEGIA